MTESKTIPEQTLVVVADGHRAVLFRTHGVNDAMTLTEERQLTPQNLAAEGPSGSRPEEQSPRQTDEATFAKQLAAELFSLKQANKFDHMVLVADPQTLGQLRSAMHKTVEASIALTLDKELTNHSAGDIAAIIRNAA
ncbi:host attachment family protein [Devosia beringensis]|uniref:host attachment family protein n=1 Tax=Devosia beringensis TaxID=2657486 RepID=UPI00186B5DAD|nr:host attachment family protein [Devosia beringensis]